MALLKKQSKKKNNYENITDKWAWYGKDSFKKRAFVPFVIINSLNIQFQLEQSVNLIAKLTPDELVKLHKGTRRTCSCN